MNGSIEALLRGLIDYAGLFPPAALDMRTAVRNYADYMRGPDAWALGRFVVPAARLPEFTRAFEETCCNELERPWLLSVLGSGDAASDAANIAEITEGALFLDAVELKATDAGQLGTALAALPTGVPTFVEFPLEESDRMLPLMAKLGARAKIRTGGITPEAFPRTETIAGFLVACAQSKIAFKATAGLHHPLRSVHSLTYEAASPRATMHGFTNVFLAAALAYRGVGKAELLPLLEEESAAAFRLERNLILWREQRFEQEDVERVRHDFALGFGSCSFTEPIEDLKVLGWL